MRVFAWALIPNACLIAAACGGSASKEGVVDGDRAVAADVDVDAYGTAFMGDGVQCGAIVCSTGQQCCLVYIAADATSSGPTHACDQDCESVCADTCPDAGGMTQSFPPSATSMPGAGGMPMGAPMPGGSTEGGAPPGMGMPAGPGPAPDAAGDPGMNSPPMTPDL
jgi:hypothetical protein